MEERGPSAPGQRGQTQEGPGHSEADCPETEAPLPGGRVRNHDAGSMRAACWISGRRDEAGRRRRHQLTGIAIQGSGTGAAEPGRAAVWKVKLDDISPVAFGARNEASELGGKAGERILFWTEYWRGAGRRAGGGRSRPRQEARWPGGAGRPERWRRRFRADDDAVGGRSGRAGSVPEVSQGNTELRLLRGS